MTNQQAKSLRDQINDCSAELEIAEKTESKAMIRNRKLRIIELERQLTEG